MSKINEEEIFNILTGKISSVINRALLRAFASENIDITTEQWSVLSCLWNKDKVTQQYLCDLTNKDKPSITRLIDNLEKRHLVVRVSDISDRRINLIHLTEAGMTLKQKTSEIVQHIVDKSLNDISDDDLNTSKKVLNKIMKNLQ